MFIPVEEVTVSWSDRPAQLGVFKWPDGRQDRSIQFHVPWGLWHVVLLEELGLKQLSELGELRRSGRIRRLDVSDEQS